MNEEKVKNKKKKVAILRGGKSIYNDSLLSGSNIILSILKNDSLIPVDILIDKKGNWFEKGVPSDPHTSLSKVDYYLDTTRDHDSDYHDLARKINLKHVFKNDYSAFTTRSNLKRIISQTNIGDVNILKYKIIIKNENLKLELKEIWNSFHMPVVIRPNNIFSNQKSLLTYSFNEAQEKILEILNYNDEALVEEHVNGKYVSLALVPDYRGEEFYIPIPFEIINKNKNDRKILNNEGEEKIIKEKYLNDHNHHKVIFSHNDESLKLKLKKITEEVYKSLNLDTHMMIDFAILEKINGDIKIKILEIHTDPHLFSDSRFESVLSGSGVNIGKFIEDRIEKLEEENLVY